METVSQYKSSQQVFDKKHEDIAERIFCLLNQGSLFEIYRVLESLKTTDEKKYVMEVFKVKYDFNFQEHI